ncbi:hypothetical protein DSL72_008178 [Monilinia vaccinii-corymbosi]|uniref:Xylanolytic transcriptional activator regulatory domain-containing protein n=1 Tax=Monilinia vaccinii-corymbosi TaxID=61207 RepID=A0A8A3PJY7_9HELO|nr:hypothetical protein DSL72_008178 [Monilinia vaccinii-corymbosi]
MSLTLPSTTPEPISDRNSISFLLNVGEDEFIREFPRDATVSLKDRASEPTILFPRCAIQPWTGGEATNQNVANFGYSSNLEMGPRFLRHLEFETFKRETHKQPRPAESSIPWSGMDVMFSARGALEQRAFEMRERLRCAAASQAGANGPSREIMEAIEFITGDIVAACVELYFKHWHHNAPIVHEASFNPCTAALPLVLLITSLGAMFSEQAVKAKLLLDAIETYVYSIDGFGYEDDLPERTDANRTDNSSQEWRQQHLEEFQGAYLTIVLQYWVGNAMAKNRVRQQRFARLLSIYRHLGLQVVQHPPGFVIKDQQSFREYIQKESYIRTATIMMMLDRSFAIFNNIVPRIQWSEIDLPFPSNDEYFKAASYDGLGCHAGYPVSKIKIKDAFLLLFSRMETAEEDLMPLRNGNITAMDMQIIIHMFYVHMWASTFGNPLTQVPTTSISSLVAPFKLALRNWKLVWDEIRSMTDRKVWDALGFERTAETYYNAAQSLLRIFESREGKFPPIPSNCEKGVHLTRLLNFGI